MLDENNPLFDLCKIHIELIFLNEKNISNINFYENSIIFYLNKYLYKIKIENQNNNNYDFYFFDFYTKHFNINTLNIPDTNLLSNKTDIFCGVFLILEIKEKDNLIYLLKNRNQIKELNHIFIFYNKKLDISKNIFFDLDNNLYDLIEIWENINDIKKCHNYLENSLKNIMIKYRINQFNRKLDITINNEENSNNNEDNNIDNNKIQNKIDVLEIHFKLGNYQKSLEYLNLLKDSYIIPKELAIFKECEIIINFLIEYNNGILEYDKKIEEGFLDSIENYKNLRQINLMINVYLKLLYYLSYFNTNQIKQRINEIIDKLISENLNEKFNTNILFIIYLNISHIYFKINFKKKFFIFLYLAYKDYYSKNNNNSNSYKDINYSNLFIKNIEKYFFDNNYSSISNYYEYNYNIFLELSNIIKLSHYKPIKYSYTNENENQIKENNLTKRTIHINNIYSKYFHIFHISKWEYIQKKVFMKLIKYYKNIKDYDKTIIYCLDLLQICHNIISKEKQDEILGIIKKKSKKIKIINYFNVVKFPIIIKFIPERSKYKFEFQENNEINNENELFIFNPWNQKNENRINYYWTKNSTQSIYIKFYNPLKIPILINNIQLLYISKRKNKNINNFNYFPSLVNIPPCQALEYKFKFKSLIEDIYNIIGIEYLCEGIKIRQYIKNDGNGIFYKYNNLINNLYNLKIKDRINLENIKIYPQLPQISFIPLNKELLNDNPLFLFEFQKYHFNFDIINNSEKNIKKINISIYAYKKDDYKITLYEKEIKNEKGKYYLEPKNKKKLEYDFIQKKSYLKIEFIIYYIFDDDNDKYNKDNIKPYLYFIKDLKLRKLFSFSNQFIIPIYNNSNFLKILSLEKLYSKYITQIITENFYFSFSLEMLHFSNKNIFYEIINKEKSIEKGNFIHKKNFKIFLDKKEKLSKAYIKWEVNNNINGIINCFDIIRNVFKIDLEQNFIFNIKKEKKDDFLEIIYEIKNNTKFSFFNIKIKILFYQENNKNINLNYHLENDIFIDGKLIHILEELKPKETTNIRLKLYLYKDISFNTTFLLIDQKLKLLYIPSFSINL